MWNCSDPRLRAANHRWPELSFACRAHANQRSVWHSRKNRSSSDGPLAQRSVGEILGRWNQGRIAIHSYNPQRCCVARPGAIEVDRCAAAEG